MKRPYLFLVPCSLFLAATASAVTATKAYVDSRDAATLSAATNAANAYTDEAVAAETAARKEAYFALVGSLSDLSDALNEESKLQCDAINVVSSDLSAHASDTNNPHGVTAAQVGALTAEADPHLVAYTNAANISLGNGALGNGHQATALGTNAKVSGYYAVAAGASSIASNFRSSAFGSQAQSVGRQASAIGTFAYAGKEDSLAFPTDAEHTYFGSVVSNKGATAVSLQSYLDAKADAATLDAYLKTADLAAKESDPVFAAWTNGASVVAGKGATAIFGGIVIGDGAKGGGVVIGENADSGPDPNVAIGKNTTSGYFDTIVIGSLGYYLDGTPRTEAHGNGTFNISTADPAHFWFGAASVDSDGNPITPRTLQSYLDERATTNALADVKASIPVISATDATFSNAVNAAARALVKSKLESLDKAKSSIGETIAALQSIYSETETE